MNQPHRFTHDGANHDSHSDSLVASCLRAAAEYEQHFLSRDALIADDLGLHRAWVTGIRERNFFYWQRLEQKALARQMTGRSGWRQPRSPRPGGPASCEPETSEFLSTPAGRSSRQSLADRLAPDWPGWLAILLAAGLLIMDRLFPAFHLLLTGLLP